MIRTAGRALLWGGAGLAALAAGQPWWTTAGDVTGTAATSGGGLAIVLAALAGALLALWLGRTARRVLAGLVALLLLGAVALAVASSADSSGPPTAWYWIYLAAAALGAAGSVLLGVAPAAAPRPVAADTALDPWKALDAGQDPTAAPERAAGGEGRADRQQ